jgi:hypothetical protein
MKIWAQGCLYVENMCTKIQGQHIDTKKDIQDLPIWGSGEKRFTAVNFDTLPRIELNFFCP